VHSFRQLFPEYSFFVHQSLGDLRMMLKESDEPVLELNEKDSVVLAT
jgi:hypothetical protein